MEIKRVVADLPSKNPVEVKQFYEEVFGLEMLMDQDWIVTFGARSAMPIQLNIASEGGSGAVLPNLSIEVDNLDEALERVRMYGATIEYGPVLEPWGVRRFFVSDPAGNILNILQHEHRAP